MNTKKLKQAEALFLQKYPDGFLHPEMVAVGKKHKIEQLTALTHELFFKKNFSDPYTIKENMVKIVSRSSLVSMFEKPRFRDGMKTLEEKSVKKLSSGLKGFLHGDQPEGFQTLLDTLRPLKLAKWSLMTVIPNYYYPNDEVFIKPTTAKGVIEYFELENLQYRPEPSWEFYQRYRDAITRMKNLVDASIAPNNAAFGGFLMMSLGQ